MDHKHHNHYDTDFSKAFFWGIMLNSMYVLVEFIYGLIANSIALIADAGHNLSDVLGLIMAWGAAHLAKKAPTLERTYGFRKSTVLAALLNAIFLMIAVGAIGYEAIKRLFVSEMTEGSTMMIVAGLGVIINTATALFFFRGKDKDLNIKGAFLHMAADAAVSLGVVLAGLIIFITNLIWIDPLISILIVIVITIGTRELMKEAFHLSMDAVPRGVDIESINKFLKSQPGVTDVHDLHIWGMSTTETALTAHLVIPHHNVEDNFLKNICTELHTRFGIEHPTIQVEKDRNASNCNVHTV